MASFKTELVNGAKQEKARFARLRETEPAAKPFLREYWMKGVAVSRSTADRHIADRTAWSAAFISFLVRQALVDSNSGAVFKFNASHSVYVGAAIRNMLQGAARPAFFGHPPTGPGAVRPEVGDLIGTTVTQSIGGFSDALRAARRMERYFSHFDVVTDVSGGTVKVIGGNVADSVSERSFQLTNGILPVLPFKFDAAGRVISGPFICVVKHVS
jgi:hypothetical protein